MKVGYMEKKYLKMFRENSDVRRCGGELKVYYYCQIGVLTSYL